jgi:hypothetical protein
MCIVAIWLAATCLEQLPTHNSHPSTTPICHLSTAATCLEQLPIHKSHPSTTPIHHLSTAATSLEQLPIHKSHLSTTPIHHLSTAATSLEQLPIHKSHPSTTPIHHLSITVKSSLRTVFQLHYIPTLHHFSRNKAVTCPQQPLRCFSRIAFTQNFHSNSRSSVEYIVKTVQ